MATIPKHRQLPDKESKLFKELLMQYELKQYKKGIKAADAILKKFPNHGETLAIKALTIHTSLPNPPTIASLPKQEEAEAMARTAVKKDITSHITWHVLGILAKVRKDWEEASRAFAMARKQDADNIPLIRDSIALYLHTRDYPQAVAARHHLLLIKPQLRGSWLGLMVAHHLNSDPEEALEVYDAFERIVKADGFSPQERAQVAMYVVRLCIDAGQYEDGLRRLESGLLSGALNDRGEVTQLKAELLVKLGKEQEAEATYRKLLEQNPDNLEYYRGLLRTKGLDISGPLDDETRTKILASLDALGGSFPRSMPPKRLPLDIATDDEFKRRARSYLINGLEKGVPSLFVDVKGVYADPSRMAAVGEVVEDVIKSLESETSLHDDDSIAPPTALLWAYYYLALHLSHPLHPNPSHARSLELLSKALQHTPTLPELYMAQAMVLKRAGDPLGAAQAMEEARSLDGQDRFLNCKAAKYWMRAGEVKKAEDLVSLFTKKDMTPLVDLTELQCLWFLQEEGDSYKRTGNLALALKRFQAVATTFRDYEDDQYDFHTYSMRRMTFSTYISLMKYEDQLRSHPGYFHSALEAIDIYLRVYDHPSLTEERLTPEEEAERKKAAKKAQKAEQKARKAALASGEGKKEDQPIPDDDPTGIKALKTETPLAEAVKLLKPLQKLAAERIETHTYAYEIYVRQGLHVAALKALLAAKEIDPEDARLHSQIISFSRIGVDLPENVKAVVEAAKKELIDAPVEKFNADFLSRHATSPIHIVGAARGLYEIQKPNVNVSAILAALNKLTEEGVPPHVPVFQDAVALLEHVGASADEVRSFEQRVKARVPLAEVFATAEEKKKRRDEVMAQEEAE